MRGAVAGGHHIVGFVGLRTDVIFGQRQPAIDGEIDLEQRQRQQRAERHGAAFHVFVHAVHGLGRLEIDPAGVEADAFADQGQLGFRRAALFRIAGGTVTQTQQPAIVGTAGLGDGEEGAGLAAGEGGTVQKFHLPTLLAGESGRQGAVIARTQLVAGHLGEPARQMIALDLRPQRLEGQWRGRPKTVDALQRAARFRHGFAAG